MVRTHLPCVDVARGTRHAEALLPSAAWAATAPTPLPTPARHRPDPSARRIRYEALGWKVLRYNSNVHREGSLTLTLGCEADGPHVGPRGGGASGGAVVQLTYVYGSSPVREVGGLERRDALLDGGAELAHHARRRDARHRVRPRQPRQLRGQQLEGAPRRLGHAVHRLQPEAVALWTSIDLGGRGRRSGGVLGKPA